MVCVCTAIFDHHFRLNNQYSEISQTSQNCSVEEFKWDPHFDLVYYFERCRQSLELAYMWLIINILSIWSYCSFLNSIFYHDGIYYNDAISPPLDELQRENKCCCLQLTKNLYETLLTFMKLVSNQIWIIISVFQLICTERN